MITCRHDSMTGLLNEKHFPQAQEFEYLAPVVCAVWGVSGQEVDLFYMFIDQVIVKERLKAYLPYF